MPFYYGDMTRPDRDLYQRFIPDDRLVYINIARSLWAHHEDGFFLRQGEDLLLKRRLLVRIKKGENTAHRSPVC